MNQPYPVRVGDLRPSQLLWAFGSGSIVDLPQISVVVMGLNYWDPSACMPIGEDRLLTAVRRVLGPQVARLVGPPIRPGADGPFNPFTPEARIGVPVSPFPRWLRCPLCGRMGEVGSGLFELKSDPYRPDRTRFVHSNCDRTRGSPPTAVPARFLVACRGGHLDDFPWHFFVHGGHSDCPGPLRFFEQGASLQTENLWVAANGATRADRWSMRSVTAGESCSRNVGDGIHISAAQTRIAKNGCDLSCSVHRIAGFQ